MWLLFLCTDEIPQLIVTTNEGVLGVDTITEKVGFLSDTRVDGSSGLEIHVIIGVCLIVFTCVIETFRGLMFYVCCCIG